VEVTKMKAKRILVVIVGMTQGAIGLLALILVCVLYFNFLNIQTMLNVTAELLPLSLLILSVFGFFSVISGLFLIHED
jgi:ABC-type Na+ efflux pump permease subunit